MSASLVAALVLAGLVGISLGLLGGGGSILTVPILTYVLGMEPREAIASSLFIVGVTSAVSLLTHTRAGRVRWCTGLVFGVAGMAGAYAGGLAGGVIPGAVLMILFAAMMIATSAAMIRSGRATRSPGAEDRAPGATAGRHESAGRRRTGRILVDGFVVGLATGLVGAGGGFLVVPALALLGGLPMAVAVGTSLLVITMKSTAGLAGYLLSVQLDWPLVLAFSAIAVLASFVGARLTDLLPEDRLRTWFGYVVLLMGAVVLVEEVPALVAGLVGS